MYRDLKNYPIPRVPVPFTLPRAALPQVIGHDGENTAHSDPIGLCLEMSGEGVEH